VLFAASDATGAYAGARLLAERSIDVTAVSGLVTSSPLAMREAQAAVTIPVIPTEDLARAETATKLLFRRLPALAVTASPRGEG
jgi:hypothetical protein